MSTYRVTTTQLFSDCCAGLTVEARQRCSATIVFTEAVAPPGTSISTM